MIILNKNDHSGIAVLFTLGILSLVIIIALLLISTAGIGRKASYNYNSLQLARIIAQSGLQKAILGIQMYATDYTGNINNVYSYDPNSGSSSDSTPYTQYLGGNSGLLSAKVNGITTYVDYSSTSLPNPPVWQYIASDTSGTSPLIARYAYRIISTTGLIDPSACIDSGYNAYINNSNAVSESNTSTSLGKDGTEYTSLGPNGSYVIGRPGFNVNEIFLRCMDDSNQWINYPGTTYIEDICSKWALPQGKLVSGDHDSWIERWIDFDTLFASLNVNSNQTDSLRQYFILYEHPDLEAYWSDNGDSTLATSELYHRFNLARTDWSSVTTDSIITGDAAVYNSQTLPYDGSLIPWIANWNYSADSGNYTSSTAKRAQIAANLIDYCDADTAATTDNQNAPTYVGLERCPYVNEVKLQIKATVSAAVNGTKRNYTCTIEIPAIHVEVVDMYGSVITTTATATVTASYNWVIGTNTYSYTYSPTAVTISPIPSVLKNYSSDSDHAVSSSNTRLSITSGTATSVNNFKLTSLTIQLKNSNSPFEFLDFSYIVDSSHTTPAYSFISSQAPTTSTPVTGTYYFDFQIGDPRQNLNVADWGGGTPTAASTTDIGSIGSMNSNFNPNPGGSADPEPSASNPWNISTAYIRNAPMKSPWELGFIHRGTKWQTLNLKKFNPSKGIRNAISNGGGAYTEGDANILDQIKMGSAPTSYGKINVNSTLPSKILGALFEKIRIGSDITSLDGPGVLTKSTGSQALFINNSKATILADALKAASAANSGGVLYSRAEVMSTALTQTQILWDNTLFSSPDNIQTNDALQEEIIGKFINLTKAVKTDDVYTVIVVAQTLKDIPGNAAGTTTGTYDSGKDKILSTQKIMATVKRDPGTNNVVILSFQYVN